MFVWKALFHLCDETDRLGPKPSVVVVRKDIDVVEVQVKGDVVAASLNEFRAFKWLGTNKLNKSNESNTRSARLLTSFLIGCGSAILKFGFGIAFALHNH